MTGIIRGHSGITTALVSDLGDGTHINASVLVDMDGYPVLIGGGGSGGGSSRDRELVVTTYRVKTAFTGASVGDTITATQVIDVSGAPSTVSTIWRNQSTATDLGAAPAAANLELVGSQALTDAQLRAEAVAVSAPALTNLDTDVGALDAEAAPADGTGNYSVIAAMKRGLLNWASLLARIPALESGRVPVDGSGVTQPISAVALPLPTGAASEATLADLNTKVPVQIVPGLLPVDTLGTPGASRVQTTAGIAATVTLTSTCRRVSMFATAGTWYSISGTATATSHYIGAGERLDFDVPAGTAISVLRETTDGSIRITELV
jgi:hypothetical protein